MKLASQKCAKEQNLFVVASAANVHGMVIDMDKFKMELVWHNCKTCKPKEFFNDELIGTNGAYVFDMTWRRNVGYFIHTVVGDKVDYTGYRIQDYALENWWWADIQQTAQNEPRFKK